MKKFIHLIFFFLCAQYCVIAQESTVQPNAVENPEEKMSKPYETLVPMEEVIPETSPDHFYGEFIKMIFFLGLIISLLLLGMWFLKRMMNARIDQLNETSFIKILDRRVLTTKTALYLIDVMDKKFILAESQGAATLVEIKEPVRFEATEKEF